MLWVLTTSVNNSWTETSWCAIVPHLVSPSSFVSPRARWATGSSYYSLCRRLYESGKDTHGAGDGLHSGEEHAGDGLVPHIRARWLARCSIQGAEYGPEFLCDPGWRRDRPGTGSTGRSGRYRTHRGEEPDLAPAGRSSPPPSGRSGPSTGCNGGAQLLSPSLQLG